jgi:hypothetical protein
LGVGAELIDPVIGYDVVVEQAPRNNKPISRNVLEVFFMEFTSLSKLRPVRDSKISVQIFALRVAKEGWHYGFLTGRSLAVIKLLLERGAGERYSVLRLCDFNFAPLFRVNVFNKIVEII